MFGVVDIVPETDLPDIRSCCIIRSNNGTCMVIPREEDVVRLYVQLNEVEVGQAGRLDRSKLSAEDVMNVCSFCESD